MRLLKFSTPTCCMCKQVDKLLTDAGIEYEEVDISTDEGYDVAVKYNIRSVPFLVLQKPDGDKTYKNYGEIYRSIDELKRLFHDDD